MPRKIIQDIFVRNKNAKPGSKTGGNFLYTRKPEASQDMPRKIEVKIPSPEKVEHPKEYPVENGKISKNSRIFLWILSVACVGALIFFLSSFFATAEVTITPKKESITLSDTYTINLKKEIPGLHYEVMTIEKTLSKPLETDGEENVERKAIGKAILYNNFSTGNQRLINNTRLESSNGLIYRIRQSVEIPGIKTVNGVKTPGSIEVEIIADQAGDTYNMKVSDFKGDFTIPGFQGSTKYSGFYGRLSQDTAGGFIGKVKKVSSDKLSAGREELKNNLKTELIKDAFSQKPDQYILFNNNYYIAMSDLPDSSEDKDYNILEKGTIYAIIFNKDELSSFLAKNKIKNFDDSKVEFLWKDNFLSVLSGTTEKPWTESSLQIKFSGDADIVYFYDKNEILADIAGQNKSIVSDILEKNKNSILDMSAKIQPGWLKSFPKNSAKIKIIDSVRDLANK